MTTGAPKDWYSAAELAELSLPGLPERADNLARRARDEGWRERRDEAGIPLVRRNAGGGFEFHVSLLPGTAQEALALRNLARSDAAKPVGSWPWIKRQTPSVRGMLAERIGALRDVKALETSGNARRTAVAQVASRRGISERSLWRWLRAVQCLPEAEWGPMLAPKQAGGAPQAEIDGGAWSYLKSIYLTPERTPWEECFKLMRKEYALPRGLIVPSSATLRRKLEREVPIEVIRRMRYGNDAAARMLPTQRRSVADLHAMEAVNIDGHTFDVFVNFGTTEGGKPIIARPTLVGIQDIYSRKLLAWRIGRTESTPLVRLAFLDLFSTWGVPNKCTLDNGRAFASKIISGGSETRNRFKFDEAECAGILAELGVDTHWTKPYRGRAKPIERYWKGLCKTIAQHWRMGGAYTGNAPHKKPENYASRAIPLDEFKAFVAARIADYNAEEGRQTEICKGTLSFDQAFAASVEVSTVRRAALDQLRLAFLEKVERTGRQDTGEIHLYGNRYWAPELNRYARKKVQLRFDPDALHEPLEVFTIDGHFICEAPIWEDSGFYSKEDAERQGRLEREHRRKVRELVEAEELLSRRDLERLTGPITQTASPMPVPARLGIVQSRQATARALKHASSALEAPDQDEFASEFLAGLSAPNRLRAVE